MTHPNVVNVFDLGSHTDGSPFIAMELLKGQDLQRVMRTPPALSLERKCRSRAGAGRAAHAHQAGIVHRDIKPANIFILQDGTVKIMDFGVARLTTASMTGTGKIVGTADYMSPEQVKGAKVDGRSDIFSVGCMLYELLSGRRPFHSDNLMAIFYKITHEEPDYDAAAGRGRGPAAHPSQVHGQGAAESATRRRASWPRTCASSSRTYAGSRSSGPRARQPARGRIAGRGDPGRDGGRGGPMPSTFRPAATAPAPSGVQPTLLEERGARTVTPDIGATEIVSAPAGPARPQPARRPSTIPPPRPVPPRSGSKGLLIGGGVAVAAVVGRPGRLAGLAATGRCRRRRRRSRSPRVHPRRLRSRPSEPAPASTAPVTAPPVASVPASVPARVETRPSAGALGALRQRATSRPAADRGARRQPVTAPVPLPRPRPRGRSSS